MLPRHDSSRCSAARCSRLVDERPVTAKLWTAANALMLPLFVLSVVVQYNDPDPIRWMSIYGAAAVVCGLELRRKTPLWLPLDAALAAAPRGEPPIPDVRGRDIFLYMYTSGTTGFPKATVVTVYDMNPFVISCSLVYKASCSIF